MLETGYLSAKDIELLKETIDFLVSELRLTHSQIAQDANVTRNTLRKLLDPDRLDPKPATVARLDAWVRRAFVAPDKLPDTLARRWHVGADPAGRVRVAGAPNSCDIRQLFPSVVEEEVHAVPGWFLGRHVIYRPAAVGGEFVRATLQVDPASPNPVFENVYHDSNCALHVTRGTVFNVGTALQLLGHVSHSSTLKLIVFEFPEGPHPGYLHGIVTSVDKRGRFFASRCLAKKLTDESAGDSPLETGVFSAGDVVDKPWRDEYEALADLLGNDLGEEQVMFLDPALSQARATPPRRARGGG